MKEHLTMKRGNGCTFTIHHKPRSHCKMQVRWLRTTLMHRQMRLINFLFFLNRNTTTHKYRLLLFKGLINNSSVLTVSVCGPTLCKQNYACNCDDKDDKKFGCSEEVLHVVCQRDTQTVHSDNQH